MFVWCSCRVWVLCEMLVSVLMGEWLMLVGMVSFVMMWCLSLVMCIMKNLLRLFVKIVRKFVCLSFGSDGFLVSFSMCWLNVS